MTVICAARDPETGDVYVAGDRRVTAGDLALHPMCKLYRVGPAIVAFAGTATLTRKALKLIWTCDELSSVEAVEALADAHAESLEDKDDEAKTVEMLVVAPCGPRMFTIWVDGGIVECPTRVAIGSGLEAAETAMRIGLDGRRPDVGNVLVGAIGHACKTDIRCGDGHDLWVLRANGDVEVVQ